MIPASAPVQRPADARLFGIDRFGQARHMLRSRLIDLLHPSDVVIANEEDIQSVLGMHVEGTDVTSGQLNLAAYEAVARQISEEFGCSQIAITLRESVSASDNGWSAVLFDKAAGAFHRSQHYDVRAQADHSWRLQPRLGHRGRSPGRRRRQRPRPALIVQPSQPACASPTPRSSSPARAATSSR